MWASVHNIRKNTPNSLNCLIETLVKHMLSMGLGHKVHVNPEGQGIARIREVQKTSKNI